MLHDYMLKEKPSKIESRKEKRNKIGKRTKQDFIIRTKYRKRNKVTAIFLKKLNDSSASEPTLEYIARYIDIGCQERNQISKRKEKLLVLQPNDGTFHINRNVLFVISDPTSRLPDRPDDVLTRPYTRTHEQFDIS
jgi:hypothetical protein